MKMKRVLMLTAVTAAFASVAPFAFSQSAGHATDATIVAQANQPRGPRAGAPEGERRAFMLPSQRVEARLAYARTALKITDAQQPQWDNFANVLRKHARAMDQRMQERHARFEATRAQGQGARPERPQFSAIDRLERMQQRTAERSARLNEVIAAAKPLYASLSPEQKQIADNMLSQRGGGGHMHHRGMHHGPRA
jgi:hypothetical protein